MEAIFRKSGDHANYTPGAAVAAGTLVAQGALVGAAAMPLEANELGGLSIAGVFDIAKLAPGGPAFAVGAPVFFDLSTRLAAAAPTINTVRLGICILAAAATDGYVRTLLCPQQTPFPGVIVSPPYEFDTETDVTLRTLIPAAWNTGGLLIIENLGVVTEVFAGAGQDQGIVTIKDTDAVPNTLSTLTPSDAGADAIGDIVRGTNPVLAAATGTAIKTVTAGLGVTGQVTQQVSGAGAAGKMRVRVLAIQL